MAGRAGDTADNALHEARSRDHIVANTVSIAATANIAGIANTADTEDPRMDRSRGHMAVPEGRGRLRQADQKLQSPRKKPSSDRPPPKE